MWKFIYTRSLDKADEIQAACRCDLTKEEAKRCFDEKVREILALILDNEYMNCTVNIHRMRAVIKVEGTRIVVAAIENTKENTI